MKILVIGLGSIGSRHFANLSKLGAAEVWGYDPDKRRAALAGTKAMPSFSLRALQKFDVAVIANPTAEHVKTAQLCALAGLHLFIEKPLSHTLAGTGKLSLLCKQKGLVNFVACNYRFHPAVQYMRKALAQGRVGRPLLMEFTYGRYLPYQRPGMDLRTTYAAKKHLGGGVLLDDIHDADLFLWLNNFPQVLKRHVLQAKVSTLATDVPDVGSVHALLANKVFGVIRADYLQRVREKTIRIVGEKGTLVWDSWDNRVCKEWVERRKERRKILFRGTKHDHETALREEMRYFLGCVRRRRQTFNTVERGRETLKLILQ
ncbi:MAG: Gfo/Idh/MocA family oxidoreductase [Parcubacteria group bacterium]|nr:Gfo/Idh/MocA family oxidoreductase [Parcubacteria group bacterium]